MEDTIPKSIRMIAIYGRVSTSSQENEGTIETQLAAVKEFAQKNNYTVVQEYLDNGWSGDSIVRPALDQLRIDAKAKIWEGVLIYDPDRLARRYSYQELVMDELREAGVEVLFVTTPSPKNGEEKILHGVKGLFAEYERTKIAERFRLGKMRKVREGHILLTEAPYGLTYIKKQDRVHGYFEVHKEEVKNLKTIFSLVDEGFTLRATVRKLQELGIKPRKSKRGVWNTSTLSHLLRNRTFIGEAIYGKSIAVVPENPLKLEKYKKMRKTSRKTRPASEWIIIPVQPIIDRALFMRVQERLRMNHELSKRNRKNEYLLAGKIRCVCGSTRAGEGPQKGKHLYYRCANRVRNFPLPPSCFEKGINARIADTLVWQRIAKLMSSPELMIAQANRWLKQQHSKLQGTGMAVEEMRKEVLNLREQEDRYSKAYGAGLFSVEKLKEYVEPVRERVVAIEGQITSAQSKQGATNGAVLPQPSEIKAFAARSAEKLQNLSFSEKREIIMRIIEKAVGTPSELMVRGYIPVENTNYVKFSAIRRNRGFAQCWKINLISGAHKKARRHRKLSFLHH